MKKLKPIGPGETLSLRIPIDVDPEVLSYINGDLPEKRNKHLLNLLFSKIKEELQGNDDVLKIPLAVPLAEQQKNELKKAIAAIVSVVNNDTVTPSPDEHSTDDIVISEKTLESLAGLLDFED